VCAICSSPLSSLHFGNRRNLSQWMRDESKRRQAPGYEQGLLKSMKERG
jgi:hypothetical protein